MNSWLSLAVGLKSIDALVFPNHFLEMAPTLLSSSCLQIIWQKGKDLSWPKFYKLVTFFFLWSRRWSYGHPWRQQMPNFIVESKDRLEWRRFPPLEWFCFWKSIFSWGEWENVFVGVQLVSPFYLIIRCNENKSSGLCQIFYWKLLQRNIALNIWFPLIL